MDAVVSRPPAERWSQAGWSPDDGLDDDAGSTGWRAIEQSPLPSGFIAGFWSVLLTNLLVSGWSITVLTEAMPCSGTLCALTTLGDRPQLLLVLTSSCVAALLGVAIMTGGMTRANGIQMAVLSVISAVGICTVLGALLVFLLVALLVVIVGSVLIALFGGS